jgi:hypothetical protein
MTSLCPPRFALKSAQYDGFINLLHHMSAYDYDDI